MTEPSKPIERVSAAKLLGSALALAVVAGTFYVLTQSAHVIPADARARMCREECERALRLAASSDPANDPACEGAEVRRLPDGDLIITVRWLDVWGFRMRETSTRIRPAPRDAD